MLRFEANWFYDISTELDRVICELGAEIDVRGADARIAKTTADYFCKTLARLNTHCERLNLYRSKDSITDLLFSVKTLDERMLDTIGSVRTQILRLRTAISRDLDERVFLSLHVSDIKYFEQEQLFGPEVFNNFPSAHHDVTEAGNCYATGRYTACVFHGMRVIEKGLHALVRDLNRRFGTNVVFNKDIEYVNWGNIIDKLESEIRGLLQPSKQPRLAPDDLQFYSQTATEFVYFKNAWRDDVSHSRSEYDENEAKSVMNHVEAFMKQLAERLTEQPREADNPLPEN
jgi:hypothetical protein